MVARPRHNITLQPDLRPATNGDSAMAGIHHDAILDTSFRAVPELDGVFETIKAAVLDLHLRFALRRDGARGLLAGAQRLECAVFQHHLARADKHGIGSVALLRLALGLPFNRQTFEGHLLVGIDQNGRLVGFHLQDDAHAFERDAFLDANRLRIGSFWNHYGSPRLGRIDRLLQIKLGIGRGDAHQCEQK